VSELAPEVKTDPVSIEGMEILFDQDSPEKNSPESMSVQDRTTISPNSVQDSPGKLVRPITVEEAARLLNISTNAVCKRLRKGSLTGQKTTGKYKDEWLVEGSELIEILKVDFSSFQDSPEIISAESGSVQDQTKLSPGSVQESPDSLTRLVDLVEKQAAKLETAAGQIGYLKAQLESQGNYLEGQAKLLEAKEAEIKLLTDSQHKVGWWSRFSAWFTGSGGQS
jgi:hypothetical protein